MWAPQSRLIAQNVLLFILNTLILPPVAYFAVFAPFFQFNPLVRALFYLECLATLEANNRHLPLLNGTVNDARGAVDATETNITSTRKKCVSGDVVWLFGLILVTPIQPYSIFQQCNSQINMEVVAD